MKWIDVRKKLPEHASSYLVYSQREKRMWVARFNPTEKRWWFSSHVRAVIKNISHWSELPDAPIFEDVANISQWKYEPESPI